MNLLVEERTANGPFKDLADFAGRLDGRVLNKRQLESLAAAGALESLCPNRRRVYEGVETLVRVASISAEERASGQESLFGAGQESAPAVDLPEVEDWPIMERLRREFDAIGFYLSAHPLDAYGKSLERIGVLSSGSIQSAVGSGEVKRVKIAGTMIGKQERTSARGNRFAFVQFSDTDGVYEVTMFSEVLAQARDLLESGDPLLITAEARHDDDQVKLLAQSVEPLDKAVVNAAAGLKIYLRDEAALANLSSVIARQPKGRGRVSLIIDTDDREIEVALRDRFVISPEIRGAIKSIPGIVDVRDV